jgi:uncharacterized protein (UPF0332 family)
MIPEQRDLLIQARDSLEAAKLLTQGGHHGFAASRAYYTMFYVAEAFLIGEGLSFSKHFAVHAAFGPLASILPRPESCLLNSISN